MVASAPAPASAPARPPCARCRAAPASPARRSRRRGRSPRPRRARDEAARRDARKPPGRCGWRPAGPPRAGRRGSPRPAAGSSSAMGDPVAGGHEVQLPRPDQLLGAQAVQVEQLAGHQPGHGLQAQVRMGPDAERPTRLGPDGADVIGEAPGPHRAARPLRQDPAHRHRAHLGEAARGDLDDGALGLVRRPGHRSPRRRWRPVRSSGSFLHLYGGGRHRTRPTGRPHPMTIPAADDAGRRRHRRQPLRHQRGRRRGRAPLRD